MKCVKLSSTEQIGVCRMNKTIVEIFEDVPDYRKGNAIRHKLVDILTIGLLSVICNGDAISEMELFGETHETLLLEFLELPHGIPSTDTFERVFAKLDPKVLGARFQYYMQEITAIPQLIELFCKKGMVITIDAMGTQTEIAKKIIEKKGNYLLSLKGNQPKLLEDISLYLETEVLTQKNRYCENVGNTKKPLKKGMGALKRGNASYALNLTGFQRPRTGQASVDLE